MSGATLASIFKAGGEQANEGFSFNFIDTSKILSELTDDPAALVGGAKKRRKKKKKNKKAPTGEGKEKACSYNIDESSSSEEEKEPKALPAAVAVAAAANSVTKSAAPSTLSAAAPSKAQASAAKKNSSDQPAASTNDGNINKKGKGKAKAKGKGKEKEKGAIKNAADDDESWFDPQQPQTLGKGVASPSGGKAPFFRSAKDPKLDAMTKHRLKYGDGKNIVAIGPPKQRNANWLPQVTPAQPLSEASSFETTIPLSLHSSPFSFSFAVDVSKLGI